VTLRARLLLALVATSAITLLVAAVALLSPLQQRLRRQDSNAVRTAVTSSRVQLEVALRRSPGEAGFDAYQLARRTNARIALFDATTTLVPISDVGVGSDDPKVDVYRVAAQAPPRSQVITQNADGISMAVPLRSPPHSDRIYVLAVRKRHTDVEDAVGQVRDALLVAGLVGLGVALALGFVLSTTLSRRLGRLRATAVRITRDGTDAPAPLDLGRDEVGDLARALAVMQDALRRQESARRHFVSTASHELRTPLTSVSGMLELLAEDLESGRLDADDMLDQVHAAQDQLERLRSLAAELLDLSRLDAGIELRAEPVELDEVARAVAAELELRAADARIALRVLPAPGPCWARGDPDAVARIARILLDNALRYAPGGTTVTIAAAYHGEHATLCVADEGPGVAPDEEEAIFERFRRGRASAHVSGFGLGLAIGRELAERQGGTLGLEPPETVPGAPPPGGGARVVLRLAIELPAGGRAPEAQESAPTPSGSRMAGVSGAPPR
jgi:signal transduction histidine kinase